MTTTVPLYVGVDQGLRNTGVCFVDGDGAFVRALTVHPPRDAEGGARLAHILAELTRELSTPGLLGAACEGYAYGKSLRAHDMGEAGAVVRLAAHATRLPLLVVPPVKVILAATGRTQAKAEDMVREARARGAVVDDDHQADAFFLARAARAANVSPVNIERTPRRRLRPVRVTSP